MGCGLGVAVFAREESAGLRGSRAECFLGLKSREAGGRSAVAHAERTDPKMERWAPMADRHTVGRNSGWKEADTSE